MAHVRVGELPADALAAAARFHADVLPAVLERIARQDPRSAGGDCLTLVFPPADHTHRDWRLAAVRGLAREHAPLRVNAVAGGDEAAIAAALAYLARAPGVTGQVLPLAAGGGGRVQSAS
jgi:hypothetical protein